MVHSYSHPTLVTQPRQDCAHLIASLSMLGFRLLNFATGEKQLLSLAVALAQEIC